MIDNSLTMFLTIFLILDANEIGQMMLPFVEYLRRLAILNSQPNRVKSFQIKILKEIRQKQMQINKIREQIEKLLWHNSENDQETKLELNSHLSNCRTFISITEQFIKHFEIQNELNYCKDIFH